MLNDSLHPGPGFRSVIRWPFIEDGAHSSPIESQPESVLRRKLAIFFLDPDRLVARGIANPIREQRRASIGPASGFRLVSRASPYREVLTQ